MKSDLGDREERRDDRQADAARQREEPHGETDGEAAQRADRPAAGDARQRRGEMTRELARDDELAKSDQDAPRARQEDRVEPAHGDRALPQRDDGKEGKKRRNPARLRRETAAAERDNPLAVVTHRGSRGRRPPPPP